MTIDELIDEYCDRVGISRAQYDAEVESGERLFLGQDHLDALFAFQITPDTNPDPVIPAPLPGAGKRWSALTDRERDDFSATDCELCELLHDDDAMMPTDDDEGEPIH